MLHPPPIVLTQSETIESIFETKKMSFLDSPWLKLNGDASVVDDYLEKKPIYSWWFIVHFFNVLFRAVGQVFNFWDL